MPIINFRLKFLESLTSFLSILAIPKCLESLISFPLTPHFQCPTNKECNYPATLYQLRISLTNTISFSSSPRTNAFNSSSSLKPAMRPLGLSYTTSVPPSFSFSNTKISRGTFKHADMSLSTILIANIGFPKVTFLALRPSPTSKKLIQAPWSIA